MHENQEKVYREIKLTSKIKNDVEKICHADHQNHATARKAFDSNLRRWVQNLFLQCGVFVALPWKVEYKMCFVVFVFFYKNTSSNHIFVKPRLEQLLKWTSISNEFIFLVHMYKSFNKKSKCHEITWLN